MVRSLIALVVVTVFGWAHEATSGFEIQTHVSAAGIVSPQLESEPRSGGPVIGGMRVLLYPTWKLNSNWAISAAIQAHTRPYFIEQLQTQGIGIRSDVLQLHLSYSRFWKNNSVVVRAGQLTSAFGSFLVRYDDLDNPLVDMPLSYGYYYKPVTTFGLMGVQTEVTAGRVDARAQFVNSSAANRRSIFDSDQYGNWAGGVGYTIMQGLRIGASGFRGPYLHREHRYYYPGEAPPRSLPATAVGVEVEWVRGYWSSHAEWHSFRRSYLAIPSFTQKASYAEVRRVLHPRWYIAARTGYLRSSKGGTAQAHEAAVGFRPNRHQLIKIGYQVAKHPGDTNGNTLAVQFVTALPSISFSPARFRPRRDHE